MKIAHKVGIAAATVLFLTISLLSLLQVSQVRETLRSQVESSIAESLSLIHILLFPTLAGALILLLVALLYNNATRSGRYPRYW